MLTNPQLVTDGRTTKARETLSHSLSRTAVLADRIAMHVESLMPRGRVRCLDVGCGDMTLAECVEERVPRTEWRCIDVPALPPKFGRDARWSKYSRFDGRSIPYGDGEFDVALLSDVLHDAPEDAARLLGEAGRVARHVLVKDHFEHGPYSPAVFSRLIAEQQLAIAAIDCGFELDERASIAGALQRPDGHFIAVLHRGSAVSRLGATP
jgi:SAM-dependent methyltransferase